MDKPVCVVIGAGPGNGLAVSKKFAEEGFAVALCARGKSQLEVLQREVPGSRTYIYDVCEIKSPGRVFPKIRSELGPIRVLVYNAGSGAFKNVDDTSVDELQNSWEVNARGLFVAAKEGLPDLRGQPGANIVVIGATASVRGGANSAPFAAAKAAQRSLAQSLARHLGPERIHVSLLVLDGVFDTPDALAALKDKPREFFLSTRGISEAVWFLTQQSEDAWTFELDLRPHVEKW